MKLSVAQHQFLTWSRNVRGLSKHTLTSYDNAINSFIGFHGDQQTYNLSVAKYNEWLGWLYKIRLSQNSRNTYGLGFRQFVRYLFEHEYTGLDPVLIRVPKRNETRRDYLNPREVQQLIEVCEVRDKAIVSFLYTSGLRVSELCSIDRDHISPFSREFSVYGKGGKVRPAWFAPETRKHLDRYLNERYDDHPALFITEHKGVRISPQDVQKTLRQARVHVGTKKRVTPHVLRHSFATTMLKKGCDYAHLQEFMGHAKVETTRMYTHIVREDLTRIHNRLWSGEPEKVLTQVNDYATLGAESNRTFTGRNRVGKS